MLLTHPDEPTDRPPSRPPWQPAHEARFVVGHTLNIDGGDPAQ